MSYFIYITIITYRYEDFAKDIFCISLHRDPYCSRNLMHMLCIFCYHVSINIRTQYGIYTMAATVSRGHVTPEGASGTASIEAQSPCAATKRNVWRPCGVLDVQMTFETLAVVPACVFWVFEFRSYGIGFNQRSISYPKQLSYCLARSTAWTLMLLPKWQALSKYKQLITKRNSAIFQSNSYIANSGDMKSSSLQTPNRATSPSSFNIFQVNQKSAPGALVLQYFFTSPKNRRKSQNIPQIQFPVMFRW